MARDRSHGGERFGEVTRISVDAEQKLREEHGEGALQHVEHRDEETRSAPERPERVRRAGGARADRTQIDVPIDLADEVAARDRADAVADEGHDSEPEQRGGIAHSNDALNSSLMGVPGKWKRSRILFSRYRANVKCTPSGGSTKNTNVGALPRACVT